MKFCLAIFLFLQITAFGLPASNPLVTLTHRHEQEFRFRPGRQDPRYEITNFLLQTISDGNQKLRVFTSYSLSANISISLLNVDGTYGITVSVDEVLLNGDIYYKEFFIGDVLRPQVLDILIHITDNSGKILKSVYLSEFDWEKNVDKLIPVSLKNNVRNDVRLQVVETEFYYLDSSLEKFRHWKEALASYYRAEEMIDKATHLIEHLGFDDPETIILDEFRLCEAEVIAGELRFAPFHKKINLDVNDPLDLKNRLQELYLRVASWRREFNHNISHIDSLLFNKASDEIEKGNIVKGKDLLNRTLVYHPLHVPAHLKLGEFEILEGRADLALNRLKSFMGAVKPSKVWEKMAVEFTEDLFEDQIKIAGETMKDGRYLDALNQLKLLESFCNVSEVWECPSILFATMQLAHYGMYHSYLSVARRAYVSANYSFAETYAGNAIEYQRKNNTYITDDHEVIRLLNHVYDVYLESAGEARLRLDFATAGNFIDRAEALCSKYPGLNCIENLAVLKEEIVERRTAAHRITVDYVIQEPQPLLTELSPDAAKQLLLDHLSQGHLNAWAGRTDEARKNLNLVMEYAIAYNLRNDTLINMRIISLGDMISEKECELNERDIRTLLSSIHDLIDRKQYRDAYQEFIVANNIHSGSGQCGWNYNDNLTALRYIEKLANYQELLSNAQRAYFRAGQEGYVRFLDSYNKAEEYHKKESLHNFNLEHEPLITFVNNSSNLDLMKNTVTYLSEIDMHNEALKVLERIKDMGVNPSVVRDIQEFAGEKAALYYASVQPGLQPRVHSRSITQNDNFYKYYVGSFVRNWPR
jgi:hypothetical protein